MVLNKSWPAFCTPFKEPIMPSLYTWYIDRGWVQNTLFSAAYTNDLQ